MILLLHYFVSGRNYNQKRLFYIDKGIKDTHKVNITSNKKDNINKTQE